jgi:hypothetical protein
MELTLKLTRDEVQSIVNIFGELPTKSGVFPLAVKIKAQADEQLIAAQKVESEP